MTDEKAPSRARRLLASIDRHDLAVVAGVGLVVAGLWIIYPPVALIVAGAALVRFGTTEGV